MTTTNDTSAPLDLDAIEERARDNANFCTYHIARKSAADVPALVARVRDLTAKLDAAAQAHDDLVALAWRAATGDEHEGPASVEDLLATLRTMRATARREGAEAMREACLKAAEWSDERFDGCRADDVQEAIRAAIWRLPLPEVTR